MIQPYYGSGVVSRMADCDRMNRRPCDSGIPSDSGDSCDSGIPSASFPAPTRAIPAIRAPRAIQTPRAIRVILLRLFRRPEPRFGLIERRILLFSRSERRLLQIRNHMKRSSVPKRTQVYSGIGPYIKQPCSCA